MRLTDGPLPPTTDQARRERSLRGLLLQWGYLEGEGTADQVRRLLSHDLDGKPLAYVVAERLLERHEELDPSCAGLLSDLRLSWERLLADRELYEHHMGADEEPTEQSFPSPRGDPSGSESASPAPAPGGSLLAGGVVLVPPQVAGQMAAAIETAMDKAEKEKPRVPPQPSPGDPEPNWLEDAKLRKARKGRVDPCSRCLGQIAKGDRYLDAGKRWLLHERCLGPRDRAGTPTTPSKGTGAGAGSSTTGPSTSTTTPEPSPMSPGESGTTAESAQGSGSAGRGSSSDRLERVLGVAGVDEGGEW